MADYADSVELASWQANRFVHRVAAWLGVVLLMASAVEMLLLVGAMPLFIWALVAVFASVWFTFRMERWVQFAEQRIDHIHRRRELYAHLDDAFELVMGRRGAKVIRHKGAA